MCGSDVFGQVGAAGKQQLAVIPAACVAQRLAPRRRWAAPRNCTSTMTVEHGRGGATAGRSALHVHQGAADTGEHTRQEEDVRKKPESTVHTVLPMIHHLWLHDKHKLQVGGSILWLNLKTSPVQLELLKCYFADKMKTKQLQGV